MRQPDTHTDNARKVVFVHGRLPQFYLTQIQRICGGWNKVDFWTPVKIVQISNDQRLPLELTLGVIKRVNYHIVPG